MLYRFFSVPLACIIFFAPLFIILSMLNGPDTIAHLVDSFNLSDIGSEVFDALIPSDVSILSAISTVWYPIGIIGLWKMFKKADCNSWAAIIPFYDICTLCKIATGKKYYWVRFLVLPLLIYIGYILDLLFNVVAYAFKTGTFHYLFVNISIAAIVFLYIYWKINLYVKLGRSYGNGIYALGYIFLQPIFFLLTGLNDSVYIGPDE